MPNTDHLTSPDPAAIAAADAALPHASGEPFAVVILKEAKRPHELAPGLVVRLSADDAGALVKSGRARVATPDDVLIAGVHFRDLA